METKSKNGGSELRVATKLSDVKEDFTWYSLQFPELEKIGPRVGHSLISVKLGKVLMIGGGNHCGAIQEILSINLEPTAGSSIDKDSDHDMHSGGRVKEHPAKENFPAKYEFFCGKDSEDNVWTFGGADTEQSYNNVVKITENAVEVVEGLDGQKENVPCARTQGSSSALVEYDGKQLIAVFAGGLKAEQPVDDRELYLFDILERKWEKVKIKLDEKLIAQVPFGCQPPAVQGHVMTAIGSKIIIQGGISNITLYDGYHWMNLDKKNVDSTNSWIDCSVDTCDSKPGGRAAHGIAKIADVDKTSPLFYIFGGLGEKGSCNDLWSFNVDSMSWSQIMKNKGKESYGHYPSPRLDFAMCAVGLQSPDSSNEVGAGALSIYLMIHGGMNEQGELFNDAWVMKIR